MNTNVIVNVNVNADINMNVYVNIQIHTCVHRHVFIHMSGDCSEIQKNLGRKWIHVYNTCQATLLRFPSDCFHVSVLLCKRGWHHQLSPIRAEIKKGNGNEMQWPLTRNKTNWSYESENQMHAWGNTRANTHQSINQSICLYTCILSGCTKWYATLQALRAGTFTKTSEAVKYV